MIDVVAAVIQNEEGKILIAQRNLKKSQGGLWEFPGGKIEPNETKEEAIIREIKEEMDIDIEAKKFIDQKVFNYPDKDINLIAIECKQIKGDIKLNEHEDIKWVNKNELRNFNFAPADKFIINTILETNN
ncbi:MAG: 8-oxo-dGTP diphosphatase MutT [Clostridia bacterium]|nr:8-oxo-dGTP diphosphatase MutT [Clostridia bacterium]